MRIYKPQILKLKRLMLDASIYFIYYTRSYYHHNRMRFFNILTYALILAYIGSNDAFLSHRKQCTSSFFASSSDYNYNFDPVSTHCFPLKIPLPDSQYTQVLASSSLYDVTQRLRNVYDIHFLDPRQPNTNRFVFDPWYVSVGDGIQSSDNAHVRDETKDELYIEGEKEATDAQTQYCLKRIQANNFFSEDDFDELVVGLTSLGRSIGLTSITPPWMSIYLDGDLQNFHTDAPQGCAAFVLSLSNTNDFSGGETMILKSEILEMWRGFDGSRGLETGNIMRFIPATFGRCVAFDPRVPHGVSEVKGTRNDPRRARVVIHGWFNTPEVCFFGSWDESILEETNKLLDDGLQPLVDILGGGEIGRVMGYLAVRLDIDEDGCVDDVYVVWDSLVADLDDYRGIIGYDEADRPVSEDSASDIRLTVYETLKNMNFASGKEGRSIVVPFAFE